MGDTGPLTWSPQAYLSKRTNPTPTTTGSAKATGQGNGGVLGNHGEGEEPHLLHHLETGRGKWWTPKKPHGGLEGGGDKNLHQVWELESRGPISRNFTMKASQGGLSKPVCPRLFPIKSMLPRHTPHPPLSTWKVFPPQTPHSLPPPASAQRLAHKGTASGVQEMECCP